MNVFHIEDPFDYLDPADRCTLPSGNYLTKISTNSAKDQCANDPAYETMLTEIKDGSIYVSSCLTSDLYCEYQLRITDHAC